MHACSICVTLNLAVFFTTSSMLCCEGHSNSSLSGVFPSLSISNTSLWITPASWSTVASRMATTHSWICESMFHASLVHIILITQLTFFLISSSVSLQEKEFHTLFLKHNFTDFSSSSNSSLNLTFAAWISPILAMHSVLHGAFACDVHACMQPGWFISLSITAGWPSEFIQYVVHTWEVELTQY